MTIRCPNKYIYTLKEEAEQNNSSLNKLLITLVKQHVEWNNKAAKAGFICCTRWLIIDIISKLSEGEIVKIAKTEADRLKQAILLLRREYTIISALDVLKSWSQISGFSYNIEVDDYSISYIINHRMGNKWSLFLSSLFQRIAKKLETKVELRTTENTTILEVYMN